MLFNPTRDQVRDFFCETWRKHVERLPLAGAEIPAAEIISRHPEYHALLEHKGHALSHEWTPEGGEMNPFLHLSLHLAVQEQISINQPPGITPAFEALRNKLGQQHAAEHALLECLGETIWQAQRNGGQMDALLYVENIRRRASQK